MWGVAWDTMQILGYLIPCVNYNLTSFYQVFIDYLVLATKLGFRGWPALFLHAFFHPVKLRCHRAIFVPFWESRSLWAPLLFVQCGQWNRCSLVLKLMIQKSLYRVPFILIVSFFSGRCSLFMEFSLDCSLMDIFQMFLWLHQGGNCNHLSWIGKAARINSKRYSLAESSSCLLNHCLFGSGNTPTV